MPENPVPGGPTPTPKRTPTDAQGTHDPAWEALVALRPADPAEAEAEAAAIRILARVAVRDQAESQEDTVRAARLASPGGMPAAPRRGRFWGLGAAAAVLVGFAAASMLTSGPEDASPPEADRGIAPVHVATGSPQGSGPGDLAAPSYPLPREHQPSGEPTDVETVAPDAGGTTDSAGAGSPWTQDVEAALAGDARARQRLRRAGSDAAHALLTVVERRHVDDEVRAQAAFDLLASMHARPESGVLDRVVALARENVFVGRVSGWLSRRSGAEGIRRIGHLLADPEVDEAPVLDVLRAASRRGRRAAVYGALLSGVRTGRVECICLALEVGGADGLARTLRVAPALVLREPRVVAALGEARYGLSARLQQLAAAGEPGALALAAAARLRDVIPHLQAQALGTEAREAAQAVEALIAYEQTDARLALGALAADRSGHASALRARAALRLTPQPAIDRLVARARMSIRETPEVLRALVEAGPLGLHAARQFTRWGGRSRDVVAAFAAASSPRASIHLQDIVLFESSVRRAATEALCARLGRGDAGAGDVLVALARRGQARHVLTALSALGESGRRVLLQLRTDEPLSVRVERALDRLDAVQARTQGLDAGGPERPTRGESRAPRAGPTPAPGSRRDL